MIQSKNRSSRISQKFDEIKNVRKQGTFWPKIYFRQSISSEVVGCSKGSQGINIT